MFGDADDIAVLVDDFDFSDSLARFLINRSDLIIAGDRVAEVDRSGESDVIIAIRSNRAFGVVGLMDEGRCGARKCEGQHAMGDARAILRAPHVFFVHMKWAEIAGYSCELIHI